MKFEVKVKGTSTFLVFDDADGKKDYYEVTLINKRQQGADVRIGTVSKADLKRLAKAS